MAAKPFSGGLADFAWAAPEFDNLPALRFEKDAFLGVLFGFPGSSVPMPTLYLDGDTQLGQGDVDVKDVHGHMWDQGQTMVLAKPSDFSLAHGKTTPPVSLVCQGGFQLLFAGARFATDRVVGCLRSFQALLLGKLGHVVFHKDAMIILIPGNSKVGHSLVNRGAVEAGLSCDALDRPTFFEEMFERLFRREPGHIVQNLGGALCAARCYA